MFRRKTRSKSSFMTPGFSDRGSDICQPENTSLIVNKSQTENDDLSTDLISAFSDKEDDDSGSTRQSSSLMKSLSQKAQSTPLSQSYQSRILKKNENDRTQVHKSKTPRPTKKIISSSDREKMQYFEEVLKVGGAVPLPGDSSYLMSEDQAIFSIKVNNKLKENPENIKKFMVSMEVMVKSDDNLEKMLAHTLTDENCEIARGPVQEPLMRMLLNVECLQGSLIELLLNLVADLVVNNTRESKNIQLISSVLRQMRFLSGVKDLKIASKLFEIIEISSDNIKREIIFLLPEIISEEESEAACTELLDMLKFDEVMTLVVVNAVANLPLSKALRSEVCSKILHRLDKCQLEFLPSLVQFVLRKCPTDELTEVINGLRNNLPFTSQHHQMKKGEKTDGRGNPDEDSYVKLTFENLKFSAMSSKEMSDTWIKIINNLNSSGDFRCVDLIMLIIFYASLFGRKSQILQLIRNKIKSNVLTQSHVQKMFRIVPVVAEEYCSPIIEVASALLKSFEPKISSFGALLYKECFVHFHFYLKQIVVSEILMHVGTGPPATVNAALCTLKELCEKEKEGLSQHTASVLGLLVKVQDLELVQVRLLMNIIAELVFFESKNGTSAQDELQIFIRKQLICSKLEQCKKGVSAAVVFGKHFGKEGNFEGTKYTQINSLLELAMGSSGTSETKRGFFNDEFATMARETQLSQSFLEIWSKKTSDLIMEHLFVKNIDLECEDFPMSLQYSLPAEDVQKFVFPVVKFIIKSRDVKLSNVTVPLIPSTLRLLWCTERNLTKILPVFHASVIMPETTVYDNFNGFDDSQKKKIMDCLFLCGNYLIECINALCAHEVLDKAVLRVRQLINVRKLIAAHINLIPEFVPSPCQFYVPAQKVTLKKKPPEKKTKKGRKRKLHEVEAETSNLVTDSQQSLVTDAVCPEENRFPQGDQPTQEADLHSYAAFFRELDFFTHKLLLVDLKSSTKSETPRMAEAASRPANFELETCDVLFLLEDLIYKSEQILKTPETSFNFKSKSATLLIQEIAADDFIVASVKILPQLLNKIEIFSKYCENLLTLNDWLYDGRGLYVQGACHVKLAMAAGLKFIAEIISWKGFQNSNEKLLRDFLSIVSSRGKSKKSSSNPETAAALAIDAANYLASFSKTILVLSGALSIVKSFQACLAYSSSELSNALADLCHEFLCRNWFTVAGIPERGPVYNQHVDFLLKTYFGFVENKLEVVRITAKTALDEARRLSEKDSTLETFKTINKRNFPLLYRTMCEALVFASSDKLLKLRGDDEGQLNVWNKIVETLLILVEIAKILPSRIILASLLKRSQSVIQLFLSKGMPVVESALRVKSVEVLTLLKSLQMVTRFLHSICCHSRINNDSVVAAHVPAIRSQCERLTLEVKGMLILNGIPMDCITIAILKNRDIKGNDIISQETLDEDSDDESELPPEDTPGPEESTNENISEETQESICDMVKSQFIRTPPK